MKKISLLFLTLACILTSLLALTSCNGGAGNNGCNHTFKSPVVLKEASCATEGYEFTECSICHYGTIKVLFSKGGHKIEKIPAIPGDCFTEGFTEGEKCTVCGEIVKGPASTGKKQHAYSGGICMACGANANSQGLTYMLNFDNNSYSVTSVGECDNEEIVIPAEYQGKPVTGILDNAFKDCTTVKVICVPSSVTSIGKGAFAGCKNLTRLELPFIGASRNTGETASQKTLFGYVFGDSQADGCDGIKQYISKSESYTAYIPKNLKTVKIANASLPYGAFYGVKSITVLTLGGTTTKIGESAFEGCTSLSELTLPEGYASVGKNAFRGCSSLKTLELALGVTSIGTYAFSGCTSLEEILLPTTLREIGEATFYKCSSLKEIYAPLGVKVVGENAFRDCAKLEKIVFSSGVETIDNYAFYGCSALKEINIPATVTAIGEGVFRDCSALEQLKLSEGLTTIGNKMFYGCASLKVIEIPSTVDTFGDDVFVGCTSLVDIKIDESNPKYSSVDCVLYSKDLKTLILYISGKSDESFTVPSHVEKIEDYAFYGASRLVTLTIPENVISIGKYAFASSAMLKTVNIQAKITELPENAFNSCPVIESVTFPTTVTKIGAYAFYKSGIKEYTIPSQISEIGKYAFAGTALTQITIPASVKVVAEASFRDNLSLETVVMSDGVQEIGKSAFSKCTALKNVTIPSTVTKIGSFAFNGCTAITEIFVPISVLTIDEAAFQGCSKTTCMIRCEAQSQPDTWDKDWNNSSVPIIWGARR